MAADPPESSTTSGHAHASSEASRAAAASPYDTLVRITSPPLWIALAALLVTVVVVVVWSLTYDLEDGVSGTGVLLPEGGIVTVEFPSGGVLERYEVVAGDPVDQGDAIAVVRTSDGTSDVQATVSGTVVQLAARTGATVAEGQAAVQLRRGDAGSVVYAWVLLGPGKAIVADQKVRLEPVGSDASGFEFFTGHVADVTELPASSTEIAELTGSSELADVVTADGPVLQVKVRLDPDSTTASGFNSSNEHGNDDELPLGSLIDVTVITESLHPIDAVFS